MGIENTKHFQKKNSYRDSLWIYECKFEVAWR